MSVFLCIELIQISVIIDLITLVLGVNMRKFYTTEGNKSSKKQKEAYPVLALCENCVGKYTVISEGERTYDRCVKCGADD